MPKNALLPRRVFLARTLDAAAAGVIALSATRGLRPAMASTPVPNRCSWRRNGVIMLDKVTVDAFSECVETTFQVVLESGEVLPVRLIEAKALPVDESGVPTRRIPFSLVFQAAGENALPQRMYDVRHETLGDMQVFLVPIGPDKNGMRYEAVFN